MQHLFFTLVVFLVSTAAQAQNCLFEVLETPPAESAFDYSYTKKSAWNINDFEDLHVVYSVFCEDMFAKAISTINPIFEQEATVEGIKRIGHSDTQEVWDVLLFDGKTYYHIHFAFDVEMGE